MPSSSICFSLLLSVFLGLFSARATPLNVHDVEGFVYDTNGDPLVGVHVYLSNTTFGAVSSLDGAFTLKDVPEGTYTLVVSMIGFEAKEKAILVYPEELFDIKVYLKEAVYDIPEITVVERFPREWQRDLKRFKKAFLGKSYGRQECELINPYVLDFKRDKGTLYATAQEPLQIENKHLGYKITYGLADFMIAGSGGHRFVGNPFFEDIPVADGTMKEEIVARREEMYKGSMLHFFRSIARGNSYKEGFRTYMGEGAYWKSPKALRLSRAHDEFKVFMDTLVYTSEQPGKRFLRIISGEYLHVAYSKERMHTTYLSDTKIHSDFGKYPQISVLSREQIYPELAHPYFKGDTTLVAFNEMGFLYDQYVLGLYGYWNWESGMCDALPHNYGLDEEQAN